MIRSSVRAALAAVALFLFCLGTAFLIQAQRGWPVPFVLAALAALPAMFGGGTPTPDDLPRITEQFTRFRAAMISCFLAALALLMTAAARLLPSDAFVKRAASLGAAFWVVAFLLAFFVAYYRAQLRLARRA